MIFDCHLDLAMNAVHWNRDLTKSLDEIRRREQALNDKPDRGKSVVSFPEMRSAGIQFCVATQIGHSVSPTSPLQGWNSPEIAWAQTQAQLAWYQAMIDCGQLRQLITRQDLIDHRDHCSRISESGDEAANLPIGFILTLEGADSLLDLSYVERTFSYGLRIIGPAHYGPGRYAAGTGEVDGLTRQGLQLLREMDRLKMILDVTHLTDRGFDEAMASYQGPILASHHNCRSLVDYQRQLTDEQIKSVANRNGVIGVALDAWMLVPDWVRGDSTPENTGVNLNHVADQIDHVCQLLGSTDHSVIGSDLDGGYGFEQTPSDLQRISDLQKLFTILQKRGYTESACQKIAFQNAFDFFAENL